MPVRSATFLEVGRLDELVRMESPVHRLDARAQAITTMMFILVVMSFPRYEVSALMLRHGLEKPHSLRHQHPH